MGNNKKEMKGEIFSKERNDYISWSARSGVGGVGGDNDLKQVSLCEAYAARFFFPIQFRASPFASLCVDTVFEFFPLVFSISGYVVCCSFYIRTHTHTRIYAALWYPY